MKMFGWKGTILDINLSTGKISKRPLPRELATLFIGGRGVQSKMLYDEFQNSDDIVMIGAGPLTGTFAPCSGRVTVTFKSPLTGILGDANAGGHFAAELKFAGFDHIIIRGRAAKPVYIWINDGEAEIKDASHVWGHDVWETTKIIKNDVGDENSQVMCIGQGGENLVKFAGLVCNLTRIAARCGVGAVWGAKKLKAVAVRGTQPVEIAQPRKFFEIAEKIKDTFLNHPFIQKVVSVYGTTFLVESNNAIGRLLTRNSQQGYFEEAHKLSGDIFLKNYVIKSKACFACPIHCSHFFMAKIRGKVIASEGCEFEAISSFGARVGVSDFKKVLEAVDLCNRYGLDAISCGGVIAYAIECFERGFLTEKDTDGMRLRWGDGDMIIQLVHKIAFRKGFGNLLAEGTKNMSEKLPSEARKFAIQIKGLDVNNGDYRGFVGRALSQATSTRGADHLRGGGAYETHARIEESKKVFGFVIGPPPSYEMKAEATIWMENFVAAAASAGLCIFATQWWRAEFIGPKELADLLTYCTGVTYTADSIMKAGERIYNVERLFNIKCGVTSKDDTLPERWFEEPQPAGPNKGYKFDKEEFRALLKRYYMLRGWNEETGVPKSQKLNELGLQ